MKSELKKRNAYFPDIGHKIGIYTYTNWEDNYPVQPYNREKVAAALDTVRDKGGGTTPLNSGLRKLEDILKPLSGRTAVFVFWDGEYTGRESRRRCQEAGQGLRRLLLRDQQRDTEAGSEARRRMSRPSTLARG